MFQDNRDISYKEGVIGVRLPVRGRGQLFDSVSKEWSKIVETSSIDVGLGTNHYLLRLGGEGGSRSDQLSPTDYKGGSLEYYRTSHGEGGGGPDEFCRNPVKIFKTPIPQATDNERYLISFYQLSGAAKSLAANVFIN